MGQIIVMGGTILAKLINVMGILLVKVFLISISWVEFCLKSNKRPQMFIRQARVRNEGINDKESQKLYRVSQYRHAKSRCILCDFVIVFHQNSWYISNPY